MLKPHFAIFFYSFIFYSFIYSHKLCYILHSEREASSSERKKSPVSSKQIKTLLQQGSSHIALTFMSALKGLLAAGRTDGRWSAEATWLSTAGPPVVKERQ